MSEVFFVWQEPPVEQPQLVWLKIILTGRSKDEDGNLLLVELFAPCSVKPPQLRKNKKWSAYAVKLALQVKGRVGSNRCAAVRWLVLNFYDEMEGLSESHIRKWEKREAKKLAARGQDHCCSEAAARLGGAELAHGPAHGGAYSQVQHPQRPDHQLGPHRHSLLGYIDQCVALHSRGGSDKAPWREDIQQCMHV